ncbi:hypothetical protein ACH35V_22405 [Actinomadura sp. 1N219]|uniref:NADH-quinone oxidoreductase subunit D-related protein n=1 Tax=Actinomadura sp. 1N219 TaxID=3375152 RepID=UPI0037AF33D5
MRLGGAVLRVIPDSRLLRSIEVDVVELALGHIVVADRFTGTAPLSAQAARDLGALGYVARARARGLDADARRDHPFTDLRTALTVPTADSGDVLARFQFRARETTASIAIINDLGYGTNPGAASYWPPLIPLDGGPPASTSSMPGAAQSSTASNSPATAPSPAPRSLSPRSSTGRLSPSR